MPKIVLKTPKEIAIMAEGGEKLAHILEEVLLRVKPGISTLEIDSWIDSLIAKAGGTPSFKSVPRYHWASCVGINDEVVHSIPQKDKIIKKGDLLKIDLGLVWKGLHTDLSWTIEIDTDKNNRFLETGERALEEAITVCRPGNRIGHISQKIQTVIEGAGYDPVRVLTGHGVGQQLHEEPMIPGVLKGKLARTPAIIPGMTLAIEIIYSEKGGEVFLDDDNWTVRTRNGRIAGLFEQTVAVTENKPLILTPLRFRQKGVK